MSNIEVVTLEIAKLARQAGFEHQCAYKYGLRKTGKKMTLVKDQGYALKNLDQDSEIIQAPSIHQLQSWLRDDLKVMVWCKPTGKDDSDFVLWDWSIFNNRNNLMLSGNKKFQSYEQSLKEGLKKSLELELLEIDVINDVSLNRDTGDFRDPQNFESQDEYFGRK